MNSVQMYACKIVILPMIDFHGEDFLRSMEFGKRAYNVPKEGALIRGRIWRAPNWIERLVTPEGEPGGLWNFFKIPENFVKK